MDGQFAIAEFEAIEPDLYYAYGKGCRAGWRRPLPRR
jgi:hypothetical protein